MDLPDDLTPREIEQAEIAADYLRYQCGAYRGSPSDAMTDGAHLVRALRLASSA